MSTPSSNGEVLYHLQTTFSDLGRSDRKSILYAAIRRAASGRVAAVSRKPATCVRLRQPHRVSRSSVFFGGSGPFARRWCQGAEKQARPRSGSGRVLKRKTSASGVRPVSVRYGVRSPLPFIFALLFAVSAFVRPRRPFAFSVFFFFYSFRHPCVAKLILPFVPERARCTKYLWR